MTSKHQRQPAAIPLYNWVFCSWSVRLLVALLLTLMWFQPLAPLYAAALDEDEPEAGSTETPVPVEDTSPPPPEAEPEPAPTEPPEVEATETEPESAVPLAADSAEPAATPSVTVAVPAESDGTATSSDEELAPVEIVAGTSTSSVPPEAEGTTATTTTSGEEAVLPTDTPVIATTTATTTPSSSEVPADVATTTDNTATTALEPETSAPEEPTDNDAPAAESPATTTPTVTNQASSTPPATSADESATTTSTVELTVAATMVNETNFHQFARGDCVHVGDGSYYCGRGTDAVAADALYAAPDADGDLEIHLTRGGATTKLTDNQLDDAAPHYDQRSDTVVWHRLINDRYQIVSYDLADAEETILTNTSVNDMEPTRFGDATVWQRWVDNNWEIMLLQDDELLQLTSNAVNDIAPTITEDLIMWRTVTADGQVLSLYDRASGNVRVLEDAEIGASLGNPRLMLVFDALTDTGDVVTRGLDPKTGELVPLGTLPVPLPEELPDTDQTGETRALIQSKLSPGRDEGSDEDDLATTTATSSPPIDTDPNTATNTHTLVIEGEPAATSTEDVSSATTSTTSQAIPDLVIPPPASTSTEGVR